MSIEKLRLFTKTKKGTLVKTPVVIERIKGRIYFLGCDISSNGNVSGRVPFAFKDEIKAMRGSKWHGHIEGDGRKIWSVEDCCRNNFQLEFMSGGNPYANWDQPLRSEWDYERPLMSHQRFMSDNGMTYHYQIWGAEMGVGKTLSAIELMEHSGFEDWWWVGPKSGLAAVEREFAKWGLRFQPKIMTYARLTTTIAQWEDGMPAPRGVIFDESSRLKTWTAKRTRAAAHLADSIRAEYGWDGFCILMSGTPSPKSPVDWWAQCEVCYPGFIKEGNPKAFDRRLRIFNEEEIDGLGILWKPVTWRDDEEKCDKCGMYADHKNHDFSNDGDLFGEQGDVHEFVPSKNEVAYLYKRLEGLVLPLAKKDCLDIPDKIYREVILEPTSTTKRAAKALAKVAPTTIQGLTWLRELSDGFQYRQKQEGTVTCPVCKGAGEYTQWFKDDERCSQPDVDDYGAYERRMEICDKCNGEKVVPNMVRETKEIKCPKDAAIRDLLEENEDQGRLVVFAGFQGSVDRIVGICHRQQWNVVKVDGRGWKILPCNPEDKPPRNTKPLDYWADFSNERVAFVAHPASGGMGLTLTEARMAVFYSNDFMPESRSQAEDRIHRPGIDTNKGATIVDLFHLGTDRKVRDVLKDNRRLEKLTLGEVEESI